MQLALVGRFPLEEGLVTTKWISNDTDQRLGVAEYVVLQKLVEHVKAVVLDKCLDDKFV